MSRDILSQQDFALGMANLERFFRKKLHPFDREVYYEAVKRAPAQRWEKVVRYACMTVKVRSLPTPGQLVDWMGLPEELSPVEEAHHFKAGTIRGVTPLELCERAARGESLPFDEDCWKDEVQRTCYLDQPYKNPPPVEATAEERLAWIRKYAEEAEELYEKVKPGSPSPGGSVER